MISVIIPNYNGEENLGKNIPPLVKILSKRRDTELIIVDDASSDSSLEILEKLQKTSGGLDFKIIKKDKNTGFSSTVNKGVGVARGDKILLLNSDVLVGEDFLVLLDEDLRENVFGVGAVSEVHEEGKVIYEGRGIGEWKRGFLNHSAGDLLGKDTLWVSGGAGLFDKSKWEKLGGLDELYDPFYWEDIDLCYRARKSGYDLLFQKNAKVLHSHSKGSIRKKYSPSKIKSVAYRNQIIFVWKNASTPLLITNLVWLPYHLIKSVFILDAPFIVGLLSAIIKLPQIIIYRLKSINLYKKSDREVTISH